MFFFPRFHGLSLLDISWKTSIRQFLNQGVEGFGQAGVRTQGGADVAASPLLSQVPHMFHASKTPSLGAEGRKGVEWRTVRRVIDGINWGTAGWWGTRHEWNTSKQHTLNLHAEQSHSIHG